MHYPGSMWQKVHDCINFMDKNRDEANAGFDETPHGRREAVFDGLQGFLDSGSLEDHRDSFSPARWKKFGETVIDLYNDEEEAGAAIDDSRKIRQGEIHSHRTHGLNDTGPLTDDWFHP